MKHFGYFGFDWLAGASCACNEALKNLLRFGWAWFLVFTWGSAVEVIVLGYGWSVMSGIFFMIIFPWV